MTREDRYAVAERIVNESSWIFSIAKKTAELCDYPQLECEEHIREAVKQEVEKLLGGAR